MTDRNVVAAKIISSKIEFKPTPPEPPLPEDWNEIYNSAITMACAMIPATDGDEYAESLIAERQRIAIGIMKYKGEAYYRMFLKAGMPAASEEEIETLMMSPVYRHWHEERAWNEAMAEMNDDELNAYEDDDNCTWPGDE